METDPPLVGQSGDPHGPQHLWKGTQHAWQTPGRHDRHTVHHDFAPRDLSARRCGQVWGGTPYLLQCSEQGGLPIGGLLEAHGGKFGQGARIRDERLGLCLDILIETSSP